MSGFPAQRKPTLRPGPGSLCTPRPQPLGIRCPLWATAARLCQPRTGLLNSPGSLRATLEPEEGSLSRTSWRNGGASPPPPSPPSFPHPSRVGPRPQRVVVSLLIGFLERCSRELYLRWVPLQTRSLHEACRGRWFQFHAEKVSSAPPSLSFSSFLLFPSIPPSLPSFFPFFLPSYLSHSLFFLLCSSASEASSGK